jgi:hypothetical protein
MALETGHFLLREVEKSCGWRKNCAGFPATWRCSKIGLESLYTYLVVLAHIYDPA